MDSVNSMEPELMLPLTMLPSHQPSWSLLRTFPGVPFMQVPVGGFKVLLLSGVTVLFLTGKIALELPSACRRAPRRVSTALRKRVAKDCPAGSLFEERPPEVQARMVTSASPWLTGMLGLAMSKRTVWLQNFR